MSDSHYRRGITAVSFDPVAAAQVVTAVTNEAIEVCRAAKAAVNLSETLMPLAL